jgi:hypothetical protein
MPRQRPERRPVRERKCAHSVGPIPEIVAVAQAIARMLAREDHARELSESHGP